MADPVTLTLTISQANNKATRDHAGKHPELHRGDTLVLKKGSGWSATDGITQVIFYSSEANYNANRSFATWTPGVTSIPNKFTVAQTPDSQNSNVITEVKLTDSETVTGSDAMWYKVQIGGKILDPEVVNKSGTGTGDSSSHWISDP
jgi:hypothetical protein